MIHHKCLLLFIILQYLEYCLADLTDSLLIDGQSYLGLTLDQIVERSGFQAQTYDVTSDDGYITTVTRVINPKADPSTITRTIVFHHGITQTTISPGLALCAYTQPQTPPVSTQRSNDYMDLINSQNGYYSAAYGESLPFNPYEQTGFNLSEAISGSQSEANILTCLPYHLSNNNYDVWLFEARSSTPASSRHVNELISVEDYWNFDLHTQALNDVPAQIAKVKEISGRNKVAYVGFSQSTSFMFILLSERPEFSENLSAFIALSPVAFSSETKGIFRAIFDILTPLPGVITNNLNIPFPFLYEDSQIFNEIISTICEPVLISTSLCREGINAVAGPDEDENVLNMPFYSRLLSQTSYKAVIQLGQWTKKSTFNRFDYKDPVLNMRHYGQTTPPEYDISRINFDKIIFVRSPRNDFLSTLPNQEEFIARMTVPLYRDIVTPPSYNHYGFHIASSSYLNVVKPVTEALEQIYRTLQQ